MSHLTAVPDALVGDPARLRQIVVNLVGNAIKFTERGEVVVAVETEQQSDDLVRLHFTVSDTGIGIPADKRQVIFEAFSQADTSTTRRYGGTGLGLAISSQLVAMMNGRIWVESARRRWQRVPFHGAIRSRLRTGWRAALEGIHSSRRTCRCWWSTTTRPTDASWRKC